MTSEVTIADEVTSLNLLNGDNCVLCLKAHATKMIPLRVVRLPNNVRWLRANWPLFVVIIVGRISAEVKNTAVIILIKLFYLSIQLTPNNIVLMR